MKRLIATCLIVTAAAVGSYQGASWRVAPAQAQSEGWTPLFDGKSIDNFTKVGDANWRIEDGAIVADEGSGFLLTKESYKDFQLRAEFWADEDTNSGIFLRCSDPAKITQDTAYEANIFDKRPETIYGTGAIVGVAKVEPMPKAAGK